MSLLLTEPSFSSLSPCLPGALRPLKESPLHNFPSTLKTGHTLRKAYDSELGPEGRGPWVLHLLSRLGPSWGPYLPVHLQDQGGLRSYLLPHHCLWSLSDPQRLFLWGLCPPGHWPPGAGLTKRQGDLAQKSDLEGCSLVWSSPLCRGTLMTRACGPGAGIRRTGKPSGWDCLSGLPPSR